MIQFDQGKIVTLNFLHKIIIKKMIKVIFIFFHTPNPGGGGGRGGSTTLTDPHKLGYRHVVIIII